MQFCADEFLIFVSVFIFQLISECRAVNLILSTIVVISRFMNFNVICVAFALFGAGEWWENELFIAVL
jgi:hypothetical protein